MPTNVQSWLIVGIVVLNCYSFGANCVERFVNYQTWPLLAESNFAVYHRAQQPFIAGFIVAPLAAGLILQLLFLFLRPVDVGWPIVWGLVLASIAGAVSTVLMQIPIHRALDVDGYSAELVSRLLRTDWIRKAADVVRMAATIALLRGAIHSMAVR